MTQATYKRKVYCPICKKQTEWQGNPHRPFCSERCRLVDLGAWADGTYSVKIIDKPDFEDTQQGQPDRSNPNDQ
jgi:hypothetical protein